MACLLSGNAFLSMGMVLLSSGTHFVCIHTFVYINTFASVEMVVCLWECFCCLWAHFLFVCGNAFCLWECFLSVGMLFVCGNAFCLWERFLYVGTLFVLFVGTLLGVATLFVCGNAFSFTCFWNPIVYHNSVVLAEGMAPIPRHFCLKKSNNYQKVLRHNTQHNSTQHSIH
jgi:hypothetical protein